MPITQDGQEIQESEAELTDEQITALVHEMGAKTQQSQPQVDYGEYKRVPNRKPEPESSGEDEDEYDRPTSLRAAFLRTLSHLNVKAVFVALIVLVILVAAYRNYTGRGGEVVETPVEVQAVNPTTNEAANAVNLILPYCPTGEYETKDVQYQGANVCVVVAGGASTTFGMTCDQVKQVCK